MQNPNSVGEFPEIATPLLDQTRICSGEVYLAPPDLLGLGIYPVEIQGSNACL